MKVEVEYTIIYYCYWTCWGTMFLPDTIYTKSSINIHWHCKSPRHGCPHLHLRGTLHVSIHLFGELLQPSAGTLSGGSSTPTRAPIQPGVRRAAWQRASLLRRCLAATGAWVDGHAGVESRSYTHIQICWFGSCHGASLGTAKCC